MEILKHWAFPQGHTVVFMLLTLISKGSTCEAPSSPECFRRSSDRTVYTCEWSMNTNESGVEYDFYFDETKFESTKQTTARFPEERLIKYDTVFIWVRAHIGNSSCTSLRSPVILADIVKYEAPTEISATWVKGNLTLCWKAAESRSALAEIRFRQHGNSNALWNNITSSAKTNNKTCTNLQEEPDVTNKTKLLSSSRKVTLLWKSMPPAAAVTGVNLTDTQSSRGCPCGRRNHLMKKNKYTIYVPLSAVNISVVAMNSAGHSPPAVVQLPAVIPEDLQACNGTLLDNKLNKTTCLEFYEFQDEVPRSENVITLTGRQKKPERKNIKENLKDFVRYLYCEHRCHNGRPQTVKMCLFYKKEDAPLTEPKDLITFSETQSSTNLSWRSIPLTDQQGFLTHYSLCSQKISSEEEPKECHKISASLTQCRLENLTPATKYIITLAGVARAGEGPKATVTVNTLPEKYFNVWWSLGLMLSFFFMSTSCTFILKRIKIKIFPPVPKPVIDFTTYPREHQELLDGKEEVYELTLHKLLLEGKSISEEAEDRTVLGEEWDGDMDEDMENERGDSRMSGEINDEDPDCIDETLRSSKDGETTDLQQLENEFAMLIYRNGLVFDVKTDSP
ncbi:interleukin-12 receptor subunit beta-2 isoform X2 [Cheilinus undulatus]|uniref:interleukin-12 receptor subunit beta-2 isoform X2 n=1 Tax=Cheilinus undulatus TaxID=241271 RepID=UPI001BD48BE4|nr:interleukin-12 receptor subunit beta-2 isoform X2 [Cheilinus undulatus]